MRPKLFFWGQERGKGGAILTPIELDTERWARSPELIPYVINLAVGCHYCAPGLRLPPQLHSITALWLVPSYTAW